MESVGEVKFPFALWNKSLVVILQESPNHQNGCCV